VTAHVMASVRISRSAGGGSMHGAGLAVTHHGAVVRGLGGRGRRLCGGRWSRWGSVTRMTGVALGQGARARERERDFTRRLQPAGER
jgi:hypothetical protein